jgi:hypothetical protein
MSRKAYWAAVEAGADLQSSHPFSLELGEDHPQHPGQKKEKNNRKQKKNSCK